MPMNADFDFLSTAAMRESLPPCCRAMRIDGLQHRRSREISTRAALPEDTLRQSAQTARSVRLLLSFHESGWQHGLTHHHHEKRAAQQPQVRRGAENEMADERGLRFA